MTSSMLSRRDFLRLAGISLLATQFPFVASSAAHKPMYARALYVVAIQSAPSTDATLVRRLWPNSLLEIEGVESGWYRLADGFVPVESVQPMHPFIPGVTQPVLETGTPISVSGPSAAVREWCAADAPLVTHIGHGGAAYVADYLPDDHSAWYAISDDDDRALGWTQAVMWASTPATDVPSISHNLVIDRQNNQAIVYADQQKVLQSACSVGDQVNAGVYPLIGRQFASRQGSRYGVPHSLYADGFSVYGAYWHNRFGKSHAGTSIEFPTLTANALYQLLDEKSHILVV